MKPKPVGRPRKKAADYKVAMREAVNECRGDNSGSTATEGFDAERVSGFAGLPAGVGIVSGTQSDVQSTDIRAGGQRDGCGVAGAVDRIAAARGRIMKEKVVLLQDIRVLRIEAGLSKNAASKLVGLDENTYDRAEIGGSMSLASALTIARFMKMPVEEIWTLEKEDDA